MRRARKKSKSKKRVWVITGVILMVLAAAGIAKETGYLPGNFSMPQTMLPAAMTEAPVNASTRQAYLDALVSLKNKQPDTAIPVLEGLRSSYAVMSPFISYHLAEAYTQQGNENQAQNVLKTLASDNGGTIHLLAQYALGQSAIRSGDTELAHEAFSDILQTAPGSNLAIGSEYYLGEMALAEKKTDEALFHWRRYLGQAPDGTFSQLCIQQLLTISKVQTPIDAQVIGLSYFERQRWPEALAMLKKAPFGEVWLEQGKTLLKLKQPDAAYTAFEKGLWLSNQKDRADEAIRLLLQKYPALPAQKDKLKQLLAKHPKSGADTIVWELLKRSETPAEKLTYARQILTQYSKSDWAPESSWRVIWSAYQSGDTEAFLKQADAHLSKYRYSLSAPRVLFWKAKYYQAQGKSDVSTPLFSQLQSQYPHTYYAFRSLQLQQGNTTHPWQTSPQTQLKVGANDTDARALARFSSDNRLHGPVTEIIAAKNAADMAIITNAMGTSDPGLSVYKSLSHRFQGQNALSLKELKESLELSRKAGRPETSVPIRKLFYPLLYAQDVSRFAQQNNLDPVLVQSLMRQESYFNPYALSSSNAMGLMQLLPSTAADVAKWEKFPGFQPGLLFSPAVNIQLGTRYLRYLHDKFGGNSMPSVGAYNGGPNAMARWIAANRGAFENDPDKFIEGIPYDQSRDYIREVFSHYWNYKSIY